MPFAVAGSYFNLRLFIEGSCCAWVGTISMGDCLGPFAIGKLSAQLSGPEMTKQKKKMKSKKHEDKNLVLRCTTKVCLHSLQDSRSANVHCKKWIRAAVISKNLF